MDDSARSSTPSTEVGVLTSALLGQLPTGIAVFHLEDPEDPTSLRLQFANDMASRLVGYDMAAEVGTLIVDVAPDIAERGLAQRYAQVARTGEANHLGLIRYGDERVEERVYAVNAVPLPGNHMAVLFEDSTEREELRQLREAEAARAASEERLRLATAAADLGTWDMDPVNESLDWDDRCKEIFGLAPDATVDYDRFLELIHADDRERVRRVVREVLDPNEIDTYAIPYRVRWPDGTVRKVIATGRALFQGAGEERRATRFLGTVRDVTAEQAAADALAESEARYRFMSETIQQQIWTAEPSGQLDFVNEYTLNYFGRGYDEMLGEGWQGVVHPDDLPAVIEHWTRSLETGDLYEVEFRLRRAKDGAWRWHIGRASALQNNAGAVVRWFGTNTDIHEKKEAEAVLAEANRTLEERVAERTMALEAFSEDLKALHRITTTKHDRPEDFFQDYLRAGCVIFDLPIGILSQTPLDPETGERTYRVHAVEAPGGDIAPGLEVPLGEAFCDAVVEHNKTVSYADAGADAELRCHSAYADRGLRSFIGTPIWVDGELFGTLNFVSPEPRTEGFAPHEHELIEVMAELVGRLISAQRAEHARVQTDAQYRSVVETVDEGLVLVDAEGTILMSNPAAQHMLGLPVEATTFGRIADVPRWEVVNEAGDPLPAEALPEREVMRTGEPVSGVIQGIVHESGETRWVSVNARAAGHDADGNVSSVVISFADVTEKRRAESELRANEAQLQKAQEIAHVGSWRWEVADDRITWSDELFRIFGVEPNAFEPTFENYVQCLHPDDRDRVQSVIGQAMGQNASYEINHRVVHPDGTVRQVHSIGEVVLGKDGKPAALQGTAQDVTEAFLAEQNLRHYADQLEERNAELEQFAYVASHDLQEPLRMVSSFLQLLQRRYEGQLDDTADEYIAYAVDGARRMKILIQDLLAYSRVGTRGKPFEPVDVERVVETVLSDLALMVEEHGAAVAVGPLPTVSADASQLRQVFQNLLANAVKFRGAAAPEVAVAAARTEAARTDGTGGAGWAFSVADNGIGIAAEHAERVFQIFQRLHSREEYEGTGIGLAMCKKIVERHGGRIWFESEPGKGSTFRFTIPDHAPEQTTPRVDPAESTTR